MPHKSREVKNVALTYPFLLDLPHISIIEGRPMNHYVGIDVSLEASSVCVVDGNGNIACKGKIDSEPDALIAWLTELKLELTRIGLEAGPLSQWLGDAPSRTCGRAVGDTARAQRTQDNGGEDRPQRRARDRAGWCGWAGSVPSASTQR
jgi:hypothetical protein